MPRLWISRARPSSKKRARIGSFDPEQFEALSAEDPESAHEALRQDYEELCEEFESQVVGLRSELARFGDRMANAEKERDGNGMRELRVRYDHLRRLLRRVEAALLGTRDLEEEAADWEARRGEHGIRHADHPAVRAEIARSELRLRYDRTMAAIPKKETLVYRLAVTPSASSDHFRLETERLLHAIRHATAEAEKWHDVPYPNQDAAEHVRNVRELHALLKLMDREAGKRRDRLALALRVRPYTD